MPYIRAASIPEAYTGALKFLNEVGLVDHIVVEISEPLQKGAPSLVNKNKDAIVSDYEELLNFGIFREFHEKYKKLRLGKRTGKEWIEDRIRVLCPDVELLMSEVEQLDELRDELSRWRRERGARYRTEEYVDRLTRYGDYEGMLCKYWKEEKVNQLAVIIYKLAKDVPYHNQKNFVYAVLSVFDPLKENLQLICDRRTASIRQFPCLSTIDLKLTNNVLNLCSLWRHQYFDIKAYGNWISLALLLKIVCDLTNHFRKKFGFESEIRCGKITSVSCRADFKGYKKDVLSLLNIGN